MVIGITEVKGNTVPGGRTWDFGAALPARAGVVIPVYS
jgi:hypothetical protein